MPLEFRGEELRVAPQVLDLKVLSALRGLRRREVIVEPVAHNSLWHLARLPIRRSRTNRYWNDVGNSRTISLPTMPATWLSGGDGSDFADP